LDLNLLLAGDLQAGASPPAALLDGIGGAFGDAAVVVNLEGPIADIASTTSGGDVVLASSRDALPMLRRAGVRAAGIANNHAGDAGDGGDRATAAALRDAGILPAGLAAGAAILDANGERIAITAHDLTDGVPASLRDELRAARSQGTLVATFHVTGPPLYLPGPELKSAVAIALEEGAIVVAAHGTHAIAPVERRGDRVIAWGLGNLAFACDCTDESDAILLRVAIRGGAVIRAEVIPIDAGLRGAPPRLAKDPESILGLLESIGSSSLRRANGRASF